MTNSIPFEIQMTKTFLSNLFEDALDNAVSSEPMEVNSVTIKLDRIGEAMIVPNGKQIDIELPLSIHLSRSAGLFTMEANGAINLNLRVNADISPKLRLSTKSELVSHKWIKKPVLEIGAVNVPIETLVNLVLNHYESIITAKIDDSLKKVSDLTVPLSAGLENARKDINNQNLKGNTVALDVNEINLHPLILKGENIILNGAVTPSVAINKPIETTDSYSFSWLETVTEKAENKIPVPLTVPYHFIEQEITNNLKGVEVGGRQFSVVDCKVRGGAKLEIQLEIDEPIKAQVFITGIPSYDNTNGMLTMQSLDVKVNPANFIYKLTAPLVNRFIEGKMEDFFPLKMNDKLNELIANNLPKEMDNEKARVQIQQSGIQVDQLIFGTTSIDGVATLRNVGIKIALKDDITPA